VQVLAGFVAAGAALLAAPKAQANTAVDLFDDRKARDTGFDIIYEARDLDLPQSKRDGLDQVRAAAQGALLCVPSCAWD
jgi:photosystem II oxygen-evolving enhancer protein 3